MRAQRILLTLVLLVVALAIARGGHAQSPAVPNVAANVSSVVRGGVVVVSFDLISSDPTTTFAVTLEVSGDGGQTYAVQPRTVTGDIGRSVRTGNGKQITWEAARDVETLEFDRYRYRVRAEPVGAQAPPTTRLAPQQPQPTAAPPATVQPAAAATKSKGAMWGGIALMGFGGTMMALAMRQHSHDGFWDSGTKTQLWIGVGAIGGGVTLLALSSRTKVVATQSSLMLRHDLTF